MTLPIVLPIETMEARSANALPDGEGWQYEPKWDGFRALVACDDGAVEIHSRNQLPLERYFPELLDPIRSLGANVVFDAELTVSGVDGISFSLLQQRLHPAQSRIARLSVDTPAALLAFDLLALDGEDLRNLPLAQRRERLETLFAEPPATIHLTPATTDHALAQRWLDKPPSRGIEGVVAKRLADTYRSGERAMVKVKRQRTVDCVVAGLRWGKQEGVVASLLLGLYDDDGALHHVGHLSGFPAALRSALADRFAPYLGGTGFTGREPGGPSRWAPRRSGDYVRLAPELVCEVGADRAEGGTFRHAAHFLRWRPDKPARSCTLDQLHDDDQTPPPPD